MITKNIKNLTTDWATLLSNLAEKHLINNKLDLINNSNIKIYPPDNLIFNAFNYFNINETKVVILGQDPYINEGQAMGLSFSVPSGITAPPSLKNIFKEISQDLDAPIEKIDGDLTYLAKQGVLLMNCALTVEANKSNSHKMMWKDFTDDIIKYLSDNCKNIVFILWGNDAKLKGKGIDKTKHHILEAGHPSPLSVKYFIGCKHFSKCNSLLDKKIEWIKK